MLEVFEFIFCAGTFGGFIFLVLFVFIMAQDIFYKIKKLKKWGRK